MSDLPADFFFPAPRQQRYCSQCGNLLTCATPPGDNRVRDLCRHCGAVHYQNPRMVVGCVPVWRGKVLLCRRAIEPRYGAWTLPAGFMELEETTEEGALRETLEEAGAQVEAGPLFTVIDVPGVNQVHIYYLANVLSEKLDPGPESLEAAFFDEADIPWDQLSFLSVSSTLRHFFEDRKQPEFGVHRYTLPVH